MQFTTNPFSFLPLPFVRLFLFKQAMRGIVSFFSEPGMYTAVIRSRWDASGTMNMIGEDFDAAVHCLDKEGRDSVGITLFTLGMRISIIAKLIP